jgi:hypothetical protein
MVTRRAVLRGTAAASIGAIAAAHGAAPAEAADSFGEGFGQLAGGAVGGFWKFRDAFQASVKFEKFAAEVFFKEDPSGSIAVFSKAFSKGWTVHPVQFIDSSLFPDLKTSSLSFSKLDAASAQLDLKSNGNDNHFFKGTISTDGGPIFIEEVNSD